jgi:regulator of sirC expression with transglutaminase-like and TPR domain
MFDPGKTLKLAFEEFAAAPHSVVDGALLVSRVVEPATDADWCTAELRRIAGRIGHGASPGALLAGLRAEGFSGADRYYVETNSALHAVLRSRCGIPISLAVVVIGVAEALGMPAVGVNFPGHFLVEVAGQLADPFTLRPIDAAECRARVAATGLSREQAMKQATPVDLVLRMLNNLRGLAQAREDHERALEISDYQLLLAPRLPELRVLRADLWEAIGAPALARTELETALTLGPAAAVAAQIRERIAALEATPRTLH